MHTIILSLATGIEEMHRLQAQLKSLYDQLQITSEGTGIPLKVKRDFDASYKLCFNVAHKIEQEQSALGNNINTLIQDKNQLMEERDRYLKEIDCLKGQLAERGINVYSVIYMYRIHDCILI